MAAMTTPSHDDHDPELAGVGATALGIALARAEESRRPDRLFDDPLASAFLDRAGSAATAFTGAAQASDAASSGWAFLSHTVAVRTRFFDDELAAAVAGGGGQGGVPCPRRGA